MNRQSRVSLQERLRCIFIDDHGIGKDQNKKKEKSKLRATRSFPGNSNIACQLGKSEIICRPEHLYQSSSNSLKRSQANITTYLFRNSIEDADKRKRYNNNKVKLGPTRSCPYYKKNSPMCFNRNTSLTELILPNNKDSNFYYCNLETNKITTCKIASEVITKEPKLSNNEPLKHQTNYYPQKSLCTSCLYHTKGVVSCCTCYWCLEALCYHCVAKDDIGTNSIVQNALTVEGSKTNVLKRLAICISCIPYLPCLCLYPLLNGVLDYCIDKNSDI